MQLSVYVHKIVCTAQRHANGLEAGKCGYKQWMISMYFQTEALILMSNVLAVGVQKQPEVMWALFSNILGVGSHKINIMNIRGQLKS